VTPKARGHIRVKAAGIEFRDVTKRYGHVAAVRDVSFSIAPKSLVTLLGPSGCGKTTILRMIAGLEMPTSGRILIGGEDVTERSPAERDVSMVFQSYALFPHLGVLENVRYGLVVSGTPKPEADARAREALATVGLAGMDARLPSELSGGQQQRVAVARALVLEPSVLLFDEPLSNLDARLRRQMREEIRELQQRLGLTVVYVTHDQAEAMAVSDRIIVMNRAAIAQEGSPRELYEAPRDGFVAGFMGDASRVRGQLVRIDETNAEVALGPLRARVPHRGAPDGAVDVAIRPEAIAIVLPRADALPATVRKASYLGGVVEYTLDTPVGELFAISSDVETPHVAGAEVGVTLARHGVVVVPPGPDASRAA
jgi:iron(III) transport system ATP-binding protein